MTGKTAYFKWQARLDIDSIVHKETLKIECYCLLLPKLNPWGVVKSEWKELGDDHTFHYPAVGQPMLSEHKCK